MLSEAQIDCRICTGIYLGNKSPKKEIIRNNFKEKVKLSLTQSAVEFGLL